MSTAGYPGPTTPMIGAQLRLASEATHRALLARLQAAGFDDIRPSHFALFQFPGPHGLHPSDLASRLGMSKQALNPLLNELEVLGYILRRAGDEDRRRRVITLTRRGLAFATATREILEDLERKIAETVGAGRLQQTKQVIDAITSLFG